MLQQPGSPRPGTAPAPLGQPRLVQILMLVLAILLVSNQMRLSSQSIHAIPSSDDPSQPRVRHSRSLQQKAVEDHNLDSISLHIGTSSQLAPHEKEHLLNSIKALKDGVNKEPEQQEETQQEEQQQQAEIIPVTESKNAEKAPAPAKITTSNKAKSPYAYMFVCGGISEDNKYKGFLYDVMVAAKLLKQVGSTADIVLYTQMSPDSNMTKLPREDRNILKALDVQIRELEKPTHASFATLVFEKFRALEMTEYRRVIFLDADAIPLANLDYIFHLSDPQHLQTPNLLRPNLIIASRGEPCNAGLFMLEPEANGMAQVHAIMERQREEGKQLPYPHFSWDRGWGYDFKAEDDNWRGTMKRGMQWRFHAGHSDQGLLYYWTKFYKRDVSIIVQDKVENWIDAESIGLTANKTIDGFPKPILQMEFQNEPLRQFSSEEPLAVQFHCDQEEEMSKPIHKKKHQCIVPYRDFAHFMGKNKPWSVYKPINWMTRTDSREYNLPTGLWFRTLKDLNKEFQMGLNFVMWKENDHLLGATPLGKGAKLSDMKKRIKEG